MRKGLTIVELVVALVMISLIAALLLPGMVRGREAERQTKCRANLAEMGKAIAMYAADSGGYIPEWNNGTWVEKRGEAWGHPGIHDQKAVGVEKTGKYAEHGRGFEEDPFIGAIFGTTMGCKLPGLNAVTAPESQWWNCTKERPASPVGLGRLWARGYFGQKGAETFYCPGNASAALAKENGLDKIAMYDADEPFWTSKGALVRTDGDGTGDAGIPKTTWSYYCWDGAANVNPGHCQLYVNYTIRTMKDFYDTIPCDRPEHDIGNFKNKAPYNIAIKLEEAGRAGIVADSIDPWFGWERSKPDMTPYTGEWPETMEEKYAFAAKLMRTNHDKAYNVLFADGSVKTYVDEGKMRRRLVEVWLGHDTDGGGDPTGAPDNHSETYTNNYTGDAVMWGDKFIFKPFLDPAYSAE